MSFNIVPAARKSWLVQSSGCATLSNCGKILKLRLPSQGGNTPDGQGNNLGYGKNDADTTMDNPQPSPKV